MKKKVDKFNEDELLRDMYYKRDLNKAANESEKQEMYEKGLTKGKVEGRIEGLAEGEAKGRIEGALKEITDFIKIRYGIGEEEWILSLNDKQLKSIKKTIFEEDSYEQFKQRINELKETNK